MAVVGVVAVLVLAVGLGLAGNDLLGFASVDPSSSASSGPRTVEPSSSEGAPPTPNSGPTSGPDIDCAWAPVGSPFEIQLIPGDVPGVPEDIPPPGMRGAEREAQPTAPPEPGAGWPAVDESSTLRLGSGSILNLRAEDNSCIRYVIAEYQATGGGLAGPFPITFRDFALDPPQALQQLGSLPDGDWTLRIVIVFSRATGSEEPISSERFFRVIVGSGSAGSFPEPPDGPACATLSSVRFPSLTLSTGASGVVVPGTDGPVGPPATAVRLGDRIEIQSVGDACALAWTIDVASSSRTDQPAIRIEALDNLASNPFEAAQNRWLLQGLPIGSIVITATMRYSIDRSVIAFWLLDVSAPDLPVVRIAAANDNSLEVQARACGASWSFEFGSTGYAPCEPLIVGPLPSLVASPETPLVVDIPGWTITSWGGMCGLVGPLSVEGASFQPVDDCSLGGWAVDSANPGPVVFLPRASSPIVQLFLQATREGRSVGIVIFAAILGSPVIAP
ncbi:MAG: hypothetical protein ABI598_07170 [Chloroflexota bacterium]